MNSDDEYSDSNISSCMIFTKSAQQSEYSKNRNMWHFKTKNVNGTKQALFT